MNNFNVLNKLGEGAFSTVYKVKRISDGQEYALKKVKMGQLSDKEKLNALNEVRILASVESPHIIQYKESFFDDSSAGLCIVMELCDGGDLLQYIEKQTKFRELANEKTIWKYFI
jgi:NIMA (never in mitosis gene a)-related kinase